MYVFHRLEVQFEPNIGGESKGYNEEGKWVIQTNEQFGRDTNEGIALTLMFTGMRPNELLSVVKNENREYRQCHRLPCHRLPYKWVKDHSGEG